MGVFYLKKFNFFKFYLKNKINKESYMYVTYKK